MSVSCCSSQPFWNGAVIPSQLLAVRHTTTSSIWENCSTETDLIPPAWPTTLVVVCKSFLSSPPHLGYVWKIIFIIKFKSIIFCYQCENHLYQINIIGVQIHCKIFTTKLPKTVHYKMSITLWVPMKGPILFCVHTSGLVSGSHDQLQPANKRKNDSTVALFSGLCPTSVQVSRYGENPWQLTSKCIVSSLLREGATVEWGYEYFSMVVIMRDGVYDNYTMYIGHY